MNWAAAALALLQIIASLLEWLKRKNALQQQQELEAARQALRLLELTETGKLLRRKLEAMSDQEALALWQEMVAKQP